MGGQYDGGMCEGIYGGKVGHLDGGMDNVWVSCWIESCVEG